MMMDAATHTRTQCTHIHTYISTHTHTSLSLSLRVCIMCGLPLLWQGPGIGLELFKETFPTLRIMACGGDGTFGWVQSAIVCYCDTFFMCAPH